MDEVVKSVFTAPIASLFIIAGIVFLFVAVVGNISGKIEPGMQGRIVSGVVGVAFVALGLAMHLSQKPPEHREPVPRSQVSTQRPVSEVLSPKKQEVLDSPFRTNIAGVVAHIVRFEKSGEWVMLLLTARNTSSQTRRVCFYPTQTTLTHEATGESWKPKEYDGQGCSYIHTDNVSRIWMKFDIADPENKVFSLSSPFFNGILDNLVLTKSS